MSETQKQIRCPSCAHEFGVATGADLSRLTCPHCEAEIPAEAFRATEEVAAELAPGFRPGQRLGNYVIESLLGAGGMAVVFRGRQLSLNRYVAIKILPKEFAKNRLFVERFESEAAVLANLNHPNIVSVIDRGREGETYFIVMEYVAGETLKERLHRKGRLTPEEIFPIAEGVLAGLDYAHRRGVVHRDIKPGNIMINREEMVKIADFGLAHLAKARGGLDVTRENQAMGTLKYMAPEQLQSAKLVDARSDLYSFGVCLYEMLTGKLPLGMFKMPSECDPTLDVRWDDIILRALKMEPDERFGSAEEMARALRELATTPRLTLAQREQEEEAAEAAKPALSLTACAACGHESSPEARQCERCGAKLDDLFDACPSCKRENRIDVSRCTCGEDLRAYREKLRRAAEAIQARARQYDAERQFDKALAELRKLLAFRTREYAHVRRNAEVWIDRVKRRRDRHYQRTYEAGLRMAAEGRAERALQLWEALPEDYRDVATRRADIATRRSEAKAALQEGARLHKAGDLAGAVAAWQKAAAFWPHDHELHKRLTEARIQLGNLNLKRSYLKEAREAATRGDVGEAMALCRKVLDLDPNDASAVALLDELRGREHQVSESETHAAPQIIIPRSRQGERPKLSLTAIAAVGGATAFVMLLLFIFLIVVPGARRSKEDAAAKMMSEALRMKEQGKIQAALDICSEISRRFPKTHAAQKAPDLAKEMRQLNAKARALCDEADALAASGGLAALVKGFRKYLEIVGVPPASAVDSYRSYAQRRIEELRERIALIYAERAADHERRGEWHEALENYRVAFEEYDFKKEPIASGLVRARKQVQDCAEQVAAGRRAAQAGKWTEAYAAAVAALNLVPTDTEADRFLAEIASKLQPPQGMVLVPPGRYEIGGTEGNPRRTISVRHGFLIDISEVTCARYAEFLRATNRPPPPGWPEDGRPPAGTERLPVTGVTWEEAAAFAAWAGCALPTEEEWECAARGASGRTYPWGEKWEPTGGVFGFGPAPVGAAAGDRSDIGCLDMAGNVAEWTSTRIELAPEPKRSGQPASTSSIGLQPEPPEGIAATVAEEKTVRYIVKGSSWLGLEQDRPTFAVACTHGDQQGDLPTVLTSNTGSPELKVKHLSSIELIYVGVFGTEETAGVLVRKWVPAWEQWVEARFPVTIGEAIGGLATVRIEEGASKPRTRMVQMDFSTGCVALRQEPRQWLEFRDPVGVVRRAPFVAQAQPRTVKLAELREPVVLTEPSIQKSAAAFSRMLGRPNARYLNVGFRCVKPLWTPPPTAQIAETPRTP